MTKFKDRFDKTKLIGQKINKFTVLDYSHRTKTKTHTCHYWICQCECGTIKTIQNSHLVHSSTVSCGCYRKYVNKNKGHTKEEMIKIMNDIEPDENGCKNWPFTLNSKGYGKISFKNKACEAHRVIYRCVHGEIKKGLVVRHLCNNKKCINIDHLALGTPRDNMQDAVAAGSYHLGEKHHASKLTKEQVIYIRSYEMDIGTSALGRKYKVNHKTIESIKNRLTWKHI